MFKIFASVMLSFTLALTACSTQYHHDEIPDVAPENLYKVAKANIAVGDFTLAQKYLEALDSRYPFGELTDQVQLDLIYVYYKNRDSELASAQIERFLRLNPTHPAIDYVYYMKGLTLIQMRADMLQDYLGLDRSEKDPSYYFSAFKVFRELVTSFPDSVYAEDARQRMIFIKNELAKRELAIAQYYYEREAFVSSIRHCQTILYTYRSTEEFKPALTLMSKNYKHLGLPMPQNNVDAVLAETFKEDSGRHADLVDYEALDVNFKDVPQTLSSGEATELDPESAETKTHPQANSAWHDSELMVGD